MKKYFIISMMLLSISLSAQVGFLEFINSVDWDSKENDFIEKYSALVKPRSHYYIDRSKTKTDYVVTDIILGDKEFYGNVYVDSASLKLKELSFRFGVPEGTDNPKADAIRYSKEMDNLLIPLLGEPDIRKQELDNKYAKNLNRDWYKDNYVVEVRHFIFSTSHSYSLSVKGVENNENDFRVAKWGDSKKIVMRKEGKNNLSVDQNLYVFSDNVAGMKCNVIYTFNKDKLTKAEYIFKRNHSNNNIYILDYNNLVDLLTVKYGETSHNGKIWHNPRYKDNSDRYGHAVSLGHLTFMAGWFGLKTNITVLLYGNNNSITLNVTYESKKHEEIQEGEDIQNKIKDL